MPETVIEVPGVFAVPGEKVPPLLTTVAPTIPVPVRMPPWTVVRAALAIDPLTFSVPVATVQLVVDVEVPVSVQVPLPTFW